MFKLFILRLLYVNTDYCIVYCNLYYITILCIRLRFVNCFNKKHLKNVGPIHYCEPPLHCQSPGIASRTLAIAIAQAACEVHDNNNNDNA